MRHNTGGKTYTDNLLQWLNWAVSSNEKSSLQCKVHFVGIVLQLQEQSKLINAPNLSVCLRRPAIPAARRTHRTKFNLFSVTIFSIYILKNIALLIYTLNEKIWSGFEETRVVRK
jgi:hypothetical protein